MPHIVVKFHISKLLINKKGAYPHSMLTSWKNKNDVKQVNLRNFRSYNNNKILALIVSENQRSYGQTDTARSTGLVILIKK